MTPIRYDEEKEKHAEFRDNGGKEVGASNSKVQLMSRRILVCFVAACMASAASTAWAQQTNSYPTQGYFLSFGPYYEGEYGTALDAFEAARRAGLRWIDGPWVDSVCYYTMLGECLYQIGDNVKALEQFNAALQLAVHHSNYMLRADMPEIVEPSMSATRQTITWGPSKRATRLARIPDTILVMQGEADLQGRLQQGGVVNPQQFVGLNVKEVVRCTAVAMYRRRQIMGPLCEHHPFTNVLVSTFSRRATRPNHWSQAWASCHLGMAYASAGKTEQAVTELTKSLVLAGQYDHEATAISLLMLGDLSFEQGQYQPAANYYLEASLAAAAFDQFDRIQDALRGGMITHMLSGQQGIYPPLVPISQWARRFSRALQANAFLLAADNYTAMGDANQAMQMLSQTRQVVGSRDMRGGVTGARFNYLSALASFQRGDLKTGTTEFNKAMTFQKVSSRRLYQITLADAAFSSGAVSERIADELYTNVLREPTRSDWATDPMETLSVVLTPHPAPLQRWFEVTMQRKDEVKAMEIADRIRRHRFFSTLPMGGRLLSLRWVLEADPDAVSQDTLLRRQDLMARYANYAASSKQAAGIRTQIAALPLVPDQPDQIRQQGDLFAQLSTVSAAQEVALRDLALRREHAEFVFPPLRTVKEIQEGLAPDQLVLAYLATDRYITAFAIGKQQHASWQLGETAKVAERVAGLLQRLGLSDRKPTLDATTLLDDTWKAESESLLKDLSNQMTPEMWSGYRELIVVPDGVLWYVPFEALQVVGNDRSRPLITRVQIRYAPTLSLALDDGRPAKRDQRTAIVTSRMFPAENGQLELEASEQIQRSLPGSSRLTDRLTASSSLFKSTCDRLIVLGSLDQGKARGPYGWSPMVIDRGKVGSNQESWFGLPWQSPSQVVLPGYNSAASVGLAAGGNGNDIFLPVCGLMAMGAKSILLSRWPVGGQNSMDLMREYTQELPYTSAAAAWQRSVRLCAGGVLDPEMEPRVGSDPQLDGIRPNHPFFWSGYQLIDTGADPSAAEQAP